MTTERGFTLLEVLIALVIAGLAFGVLFSGALGGLRGADTAGHYQEAIARARSRLAALDVPGRLTPSDRQGDDGGGYRFRERISVLGTLPPLRSSGPSPTQPSATLYAVEVAISWSERQVRLSTERIGTGGAVHGP
jgi:general secretion pathway protein I